MKALAVDQTGKMSLADVKAEGDKSNQFDNFDRLFRQLISVPKTEVEKLETKERTKNRRSRAQKKAAKRRKTIEQNG